MNFTPNDLQNLELKKSFMGYNEDEVKDIMQKVIEDYSNYIHENVELRGRVGILNEGIQHYKNIEDALNNTLIIAQQTGEDIRKSSYERAENIIKDAEMRAQKIINNANEEVIRLKYEYEETRKNLQLYKARAQTLLAAQLEVLRDVEEKSVIVSGIQKESVCS